MGSIGYKAWPETSGLSRAISGQSLGRPLDEEERLNEHQLIPICKKRSRLLEMVHPADANCSAVFPVCRTFQLFQADFNRLA